MGNKSSIPSSNTPMQLQVINNEIEHSQRSIPETKNKSIIVSQQEKLQFVEPVTVLNEALCAKPANLMEYDMIITSYLEQSQKSNKSQISNDIVSIIKLYHPFHCMIEEKVIKIYQQYSPKIPLTICVKYLIEEYEKCMVDDKNKLNKDRFVANFLYSYCKYFDRKSVGMCLAQKQELFIEYVSLLNFKSKSIHCALRSFLTDSGFILPIHGATNISIFIDIFAEIYCRDNQYMHLEKEDVHILSCSLVMASSVSQIMTKEKFMGFITNSTKNQIPKNIVIDAYNDISNKPIIVSILCNA